MSGSGGRGEGNRSGPARSGEGPDVGVYVCDGYANQGWQLPASAPGLIVSLASGGPRCLSAVGAQAHGAQFIIDETGSGQVRACGVRPST